MAFKVGLALGGGGGRGLAHIGVLEGLERAGIKIDIVTGTSIGAIIGGLYAFTGSAAEGKERIELFIKSEEFRKTKLIFLKKPHKLQERRALSIANIIRRGIFFSLSATTRGYMPEEDYLKLFDNLIEDVMIEDACIPFACVATDLNTGSEVVLKSGPFKKAACGSAAIPGVYPPVSLDGHQLADGGWVSVVPVRAAFEAGADLVIAVDVTRETKVSSRFKTGLEISIRANEISREKLKELQLKDADILLSPDVGTVHWADFGKAKLCIEKGLAAVWASAPAIKRKIFLGKLKKIFMLKNPFSSVRNHG